MLIAGALIFILAVVTVVGALTAYQFPEPVTEQAEKTDLLYQAVLAISFFVFFGVTAGIIFAIFRYRRRPGDPLPEQIHGSDKLEFTWTVIPILILIGLFVPSLLLVIDLKTPPDANEIDLTVEAIGHQWWWEFDYPDDGVKVQTTPPNYDDLQPPVLVLPVGQDIVIKVRSTDVIHSFYAPNTLYKIQAVPGNINELHLKITKAGIYTGQCYQFCGLRHSDMRFVIDARSEADYEAWLREAKATQGTVPEQKQLAETQ
ncbi:MAG TPA: cytochrome c oxidase subunit II [Dehalococcoidia bacterium]|nr:cytochrome c oxidase subunit II [Dehalococcoidia bacterium]